MNEVNNKLFITDKIQCYCSSIIYVLTIEVEYMYRVSVRPYIFDLYKKTQHFKVPNPNLLIKLQSNQ